MIQFIEPFFVTNDGRGTIEGLINFGSWEELNHITSDKDAIRGNHYHKVTREAFIILSGCILVSVQKVTGNQLDGETKLYRVGKGQVFVIEPMVNHIFSIEEPAEWINLLSHRMDQNNHDFFKIDIKQLHQL